MPAYESMPLAEQAQLIQREYCNDVALRDHAAMWNKAATELPQMSTGFQAATAKAKEANWEIDDVGAAFVAKSGQTQQVIDGWKDKVASAGAGPALERVAGLVKPTYETVRQAVTDYNNEVKTAVNAEEVRRIELKYRQIAGAAMNTLAAAATEATTAVEKLRGAPEWRGVNDAGPGTGPGAGPANRGGGPASPTSAQTGAPTDSAAGAPAGGPAGSPAGGAAGAPEGGAAGGPTGGAAGGPAGGPQIGMDDPSLSGGLGSAPQIPSPMIPQLPGAGTPIPGAGGPLIPPMMSPTGGLGGGGGRGIGGGGGGIRVPGVSLGGGPNATIPAAGGMAAGPVNQMPTGTAPAVQAISAGGTAAATAAGGGMPMMPPMGGMGAGAGLGGGGGAPGSGAAARSAPGRGRKRDGQTPGLVGPLSGKAGKADPNAFTARRQQAEESDIPSTVQLIDEDLWQVEQRTPAARP